MFQKSEESKSLGTPELRTKTIDESLEKKPPEYLTTSQNLELLETESESER